MSDLQTSGHAVSPATRVPYERRGAGKPGIACWRRAVADVLSAVALATFGSHKVAAAACGVDDREFGKWCSGTRRPQIDRLLGCDALRTPLLLALGRLDGAIEVVQQFRHVERRRRRLEA